MLNYPIRDRRAWRSDTLDSPDEWRLPLPPRCRKVVDQVVTDLRRRPRPATDLRVEDTPLAGCRDDLRPARDELERGRGFVIIHGLERDRYSPDELTAVYWLVGQLLGVPFVQNVQGTLLYDVKDTGQDVRYGARFSVTSAESTFHTDNSFGEDVLDYVGLLCLNTARAGGLSQMVNIYAVHNRLLQTAPDVLAVLYRPFHVDRRGGVRPGEPPTVQFPILAWDGRSLLCRYLRYWIEVGQEKAGAPLSQQQKDALSAFDRALAEPALRAEFPLQPGDMYFLNNRWILHNRTAFDDHDEPARKRHLVRLWLQRASEGRRE